MCGGQGTRLAEQTEVRPKPLVEIGGRPILWHIMKHYARHGFTEFVLALGHKGDQIKRYFLGYQAVWQDITVNLQDGSVNSLNKNPEPWTIHLVDTGESTKTGGRLRQLRSLIGDGTFMLTYGDGVGNVRLDELLAFHRSRNALVTLNRGAPAGPLCALEFDAIGFDISRRSLRCTKPGSTAASSSSSRKALDYVEADVMWEHAPMEGAATDGQLVAYRHEEFWQCMDHRPDLRYLESLWTGQAPWKTWRRRGLEPAGDDLDHVLGTHERLWEDSGGARVFPDRRYGFFGCCLLDTVCGRKRSPRARRVGCRAARGRSAFESKASALASHPALSLQSGDVRSLTIGHGARSRT